MNDVSPYDLSIFNLVKDEIAQQRVTGHDVDGPASAFAALDPSDTLGLEQVFASLHDLPRSADWPYEEPESLEDIVDSFGSVRPSTVPAVLPDDVLRDKVHGGWLGRIAGCNLGKPIENGEHWTANRIRSYLELAAAWPLTDYVPALDPMPDGFRFQDCWVNTTRGNVDGSDRDDDIDYSILSLYLLERHGGGLTTRDVANSWLEMLPYQQLWTAERATYRNLVNAVPVEQAGSLRNPYREWVGALIRGDAYGWISPDDPLRAITLAYRDATLSHAANGVYGELWSAALIAVAFTSADAREALERSLAYVPPRSRLAEALRFVLALRDQGKSWDEAIIGIQETYSDYHWVHVIGNASLIAAGLLWGDGDFSAMVGLTVSGGWDTDSNGATAGSVSGVLHGVGRLPGHFVEPLRDRVGSHVVGFDNSSIGELAARTVTLARAPVDL